MSEQNVAENQTAENVSEPEFTLADVEQRYFSPAELAEAQLYMTAVASVVPENELKANFDGQNVKPGYGIAIYPIKKRSEKQGEGNITIGVAICQIPDPDTIAELPDNKGVDFIRDAVLDRLLTKIATAYRPRTGETEAERKKREASVPVDIEAFMTSTRGDGTLKTYTKIAPEFVKALRKMGLKLMSPQMLRQVISSKAFAEGQFPKIAQDKWVALISKMISAAKEQKLDPSILQHWLDSRDERPANEIDDLNMDELDRLV